MIRVSDWSVTTDGSGDGTDLVPCIGFIERIDYVGTGGAATTDATFSTEAGGGNAETVLTLTNVGTGTTVDYPRRPALQDETGADLTVTDAHLRPRWVAKGAVTVTIAQGGDTNTYTGSIVYDDGA